MWGAGGVFVVGRRLRLEDGGFHGVPRNPWHILWLRPPPRLPIGRLLIRIERDLMPIRMHES